MPHSIKKMPIVVRVNRGSRKALRSIFTPFLWDFVDFLFLPFFEPNLRKEAQCFFSVAASSMSDDIMEESDGVCDPGDASINSCRPRIRQFAMIIRARHIKPTILTAHANPTFGVAAWIIRGKTMPPIEPPVVARPIA